MTPSIQFPATLLLQAQNLDVAFFDVDGVLTDGGVYFSGEGETLKRFNTLDGHGLKLLQKAGITPVVISGRDSAAVRNRVASLGVEHAHFAVTNKRLVAEKVLQELKKNWVQAAAMGDDWPDIPVMYRSAFACAPANAHVEVRTLAQYVTAASGGAGAAREFCDLLLVASGKYARFLQEEITL